MIQKEFWLFRLVQWVVVDFFWKCSYWGVPQEELNEMGKRVEDGGQYMKRHHVGLDIDALDRRLFQTKPGEPCLLVVAVVVFLAVSFVVVVQCF